MNSSTLPSPAEMYEAAVHRDASYEGVFITAVRTTGIFCRPTCPAKKPRFENVEFYGSARDALLAGYRPCMRCRPMEQNGEIPEWLATLLDEVERDPTKRWHDADLRARSVDPSRVRRWFKANHGMTFHAYQRARRLGLALGRIRHGANLTHAAYDHGYESDSGFRDAFGQLFGTTPGQSRSTELMVLTRLPTPLGPMVAGATDEGVCLLEFADRRMLETQLERLQRRLGCEMAPGDHQHIDHLAGELKEYFAGTRKQFSIPLVVPGTDFQQLVWEKLCGIPYGQTRSYTDQARLIGQPIAVRAVARANGDNRIAIIIPCHRVIRSDGSLSGYGGGLWRKQFLIDHERRYS
jgi:AraC family transcriptional regulator of adaptative response/methylated-DNA-[protein]-cysteine methyltransferase